MRRDARARTFPGTPAKSLVRMFEHIGNPTAEDLLGVISALHKETEGRLAVAVVANAA